MGRCGGVEDGERRNEGGAEEWKKGKGGMGLKEEWTEGEAGIGKRHSGRGKEN